jgi:hypothetical protein
MKRATHAHPAQASLAGLAHPGSACLDCGKGRSEVTSMIDAASFGGRKGFWLCMQCYLARQASGRPVSEPRPTIPEPLRRAGGPGLALLGVVGAGAGDDAPPRRDWHDPDDDRSDR